MHRFARTLSTGLVAALVPSALAHDFWLSPASYWHSQSDDLEITLLNGHVGDPNPYSYNPRHARRFWIVDPDGRRGLPRTETGANPAGIWTPQTSGVHVIAYDSHPQSIELPAAKFESYLAEEGLESISAERERRGESSEPGRELFSRAAKSIVFFEDSAAEETAKTAGFDQVVGLKLEIVPVTDPFSASATGEMTVRVLWRGEPLSNARIDAEPLHTASTHAHQHQHGHDHTHHGNHARTNERGEATFHHLTSDAWLFTCTHMERASSADADWSSVWASLTCRLAPPAGG